MRRPSDKAKPLRWLEDRQGQRVYACNDPVRNPVVKTKVQPRYSKSARRDYRQGLVWLEAIIATDGRIQQADVVTSPSPVLSQAATKAILRWIYEPATLEGKAIPVFFNIIVDFSLIE